MILETVVDCKFRRFSRLFCPLFDSKLGSNIDKSIWPPNFEVENRLKRTRKSTEISINDSLLKKEFYFVRHGQTDHNILEGAAKGDHPEDISLNTVGRNQAAAIEPMIALLPVQTICASPMKRAQETKEIITARLSVPHYEIGNLSECSGKIWKEMARLGMYSPFPSDGEARLFMERVRDGINHALSLPGPSLIVAHGGVHWAVCCMMGIENHEWAVSNCTVVHFSIGTCGQWIATKLS